MARRAGGGWGGRGPCGGSVCLRGTGSRGRLPQAPRRRLRRPESGSVRPPPSELLPPPPPPPRRAPDRPPPACSLARPSGPGAKRGGGQPRRPWTARAEQPPRSPWPSPLPSPTPAVPSPLFALRLGKAGKRRGLTRREKEGSGEGGASVSPRAIAHRPRNHCAARSRDDFYPICAPFLPNPKMKGQKLALTLVVRMATCAFSAASPGEKARRA